MTDDIKTHDVIAATHDMLATRMAALVDKTISDAITRHLGHADWTPQALQGRLSILHTDKRYEIYCLDAVPLLRLGPWKMPPFRLDSTNTHISASRTVEILQPPPVTDSTEAVVFH